MTRKTASLLNVGAIVTLYLLAQVVATAAVLVWANRDAMVSGRSIDTTVLAAQPKLLGVGLLVANLALALTLWATRLVRRQPFPAPPAGSLSLWAVAPAAFLLTMVGFDLLVQPIGLNDGGTSALFEDMTGNALCFISLTFVGPVAEELVFREGIQRHFRAMPLRAPWAITATAALFAVMHGNAAQGLPAFVSGLLLGLLYERTGDIRLSAAAHVLNNTLAVVLLGFPRQTEALEHLPAATAVGAGCLLASAGAALFVWWWTHANPQLPRQ